MLQPAPLGLATSMPQQSGYHTLAASPRPLAGSVRGSGGSRCGLAVMARAFAQVCACLSAGLDRGGSGSP